MKGNKFLAAVLAASMAFSAVPVTAISTFAKTTPVVTTADGDAAGAAVTVGEITGVYSGMADNDLLNLLKTKDSGISAVTIDANKTKEASIELGDDGNYKVNYGSLSGTLTKMVGGTSTTYNFTVDADQIKSAGEGAALATDLVKKYLTETNVHADLASVTHATTALLNTADNKYKAVITALKDSANYHGVVSPTLNYTVSSSSALGYSTIEVTGSVGSTNAGVPYSFPAADVLPDDGSTINASSYKIEDAKDNATLISEFEAAYSKDHTGITYINPKVYAYTASTHNGATYTDGSMSLSVTLKDADGNQSKVKFTSITLKHGINIMKSDVEDAANKELKAIKKNAETALSLNGSKLSKDALAGKIKAAMENALKISSNHPYNDLIDTETDDYKKIDVDITDYTPATATSEGSASGTIKFTYDYRVYMRDGSYSTGVASTDISSADDDLSAYQSEVSFDFDLDKLDEVDATSIKQIDATRKYIDSNKKVQTNTLGSNISSIKLLARGTEDPAHATNANGKVKYATLTAVMRPSDANTYTINWKSADEKIVTVTADEDDSANAVITGLTKGKTTVTAELVDESGKTISSKTIKVNVEGFQFDDVQDTNKFYYNPVYDLYDNKIVAGTSSTTFSPKKAVTRAEFVQMLYATSGKTVTAESKFSDVAGTAWYAAAVTWAVDNNITAGTDKNTFSPNKTITRAEAMTMLYAAYGHGKTYNATHSFTDVKDTAYYKEAVNWAVYYDVTAGTTGTTFGSNDPCDRGQAATFIDAVKRYWISNID